MKHEIKSSSDLGHAIRAVRKTSGVRLDDLSGIIGVSKQTTANLEYGKDTVSLGTALRHLQELGITLYVDIPSPEAMKQLLKLSSKDPGAVERIKAELEQPTAQLIRPSGFSSVMAGLLGPSTEATPETGEALPGSAPLNTQREKTSDE